MRRMSGHRKDKMNCSEAGRRPILCGMRKRRAGTDIRPVAVLAAGSVNILAVSQTCYVSTCLTARTTSCLSYEYLRWPPGTPGSICDPTHPLHTVPIHPAVPARLIPRPSATSFSHVDQPQLLGLANA